MPAAPIAATAINAINGARLPSAFVADAATSASSNPIGANAAPIGVTRYTGLYTFKSILGSNLILYNVSIIRVLTFNCTLKSPSIPRINAPSPVRNTSSIGLSGFFDA